MVPDNELNKTSTLRTQNDAVDGDLTTQVNSLTERNLDLISKIDDKTEEFNSSREELQKSQAQLMAREAEVYALQIKIQQLETTKNSDLETLTSIRRQLEETQAARDTDSQIVKKQLGLIEQQAADLQIFKQGLNELEKENNILQNRIAASEETNNKKLQTLQDNLNTAFQENNHARDLLEKKQKENVQLLEENRQLTDYVAQLVGQVTTVQQFSEEYASKNKQLTRELETLGTNLAEKEDRVTALSKLLEEKKQNINELSNNLENQKKVNFDLDEHIKELQRDISRLQEMERDQNKNLQEKIQALQQERDSVRESFSNARESTNRLESLLTEANKVRDEELEKQKQLTEELKESKSKVDELTKALDDNKDILAGEISKVNQLTRILEQSVSQEEHKYAMQGIGFLQDELAEIKSVLADEDEQNSSALDIAINFQNRFSKLKEANDELALRNGNLEEQVGRLNGELSTIKHEYNVIIDDFITARTEITEVRDQLHLANIESQHLRDKIDQAAAKHAEELEALKQNYERALSQVTERSPEANQERESLKQERAQAEKTLGIEYAEARGQLEAQLQESKRNIQDLNESVEKLSSDLNIKTSEADELRVELLRLSNENAIALERAEASEKSKVDELKVQSEAIAAAVEQTNTLNVELEGARSENATLKERISTLDNENNKSQARIGDLTTQVNSLAERNLDLISEIDNKTEELDLSREELQKSQAQLIAREAEVYELQTKIKQLETTKNSDLETLTTIRRQLEETQAARDTDSQTVKKQLGLLEQQAADLQIFKQGLNELEKENNILQNRIAASEETNNKKLQTLQDNLNTAFQENNHARDLLERKQQENVLLLEENRQLTDYVAQLLGQTATAQQISEDYSSKNKKLTSELETLRTNLSEKEDRVTSLSKLLEEKKQNIDELSNNLENQKKVNWDLYEQINEIKREISRLQESNSDQNKNLQNDIQVKQQEIVDLTGKINVSTKLARDLEAHLNVAKKERDEALEKQTQLTKELQESKSEVDELTQSLSQHKDLLATEISKVNQLTRILEQSVSQEEHKYAMQGIGFLQDELAEIKSVLADEDEQNLSALDVVLNFHNRFRKLEEANDELALKNGKLEEQVKRLDGELLTIKNELTVAQETVDAAKAETNQVREELKTEKLITQELSEQLKTAAQKTQSVLSELEQAKLEIENLKAQNEILRQRSVIEDVAVKPQIEEQRTAIAETGVQIQDLESKAEEVLEENAVLRQEFDPHPKPHSVNATVGTPENYDLKIRSPHTSRVVSKNVEKPQVGELPINPFLDQESSETKLPQQAKSPHKPREVQRNAESKDNAELKQASDDLDETIDGKVNFNLGSETELPKQAKYPHKPREVQRNAESKDNAELKSSNDLDETISGELNLDLGSEMELPGGRGKKTSLARSADNAKSKQTGDGSENVGGKKVDSMLDQESELATKGHVKDQGRGAHRQVFRDTNQVLHEENVTLQRQVNSLTKELMAANLALSNDQAKVEEAAKELTTTVSTLTTAQETLAALKVEAKTMQTAHEEAMEAASNDVQLQTTLIEQHTTEKDGLTRKLDDAAKEIISLQGKLQTQAKQLEESTKNVSELSVGLKLSQDENTRLKLEIAQAQVSQLVSAEDKGRLTSELEAANELTIQAMNQASGVANQLASATETIGQLQSAVATLSKDNENLRVETATLKTQVNDLTQKLAATQNGLQEEQTKVTQAENELKSTRTQLTTAKDTLAALKVEAEKMQAAHAEAMEAARNDVKVQATLIEQHNTKNEELTGKLATAEKEIERLSNDLQTQGKVLEQSSKEVADLTAKLQTAEQDSNSLREQLSQAKDISEKGKASLNKELQQAQTSTAAAEKQAAEIAKQLTEATQQNKQLQTDVEELRTVTQRLQTENATLQTKVGQLTNELDVTRKSLGEEQVKVTEAQVTLQTTRTELTTAQQTLNELKVEANHMQIAHKKAMEEAANKSQETQKKLTDQHNNEKESLTDKLTTAQKEVEHLGQELQTQGKQLEESTQNVSELSASLKLSREENTRLQSQIAQEQLLGAEEKGRLTSELESALELTSLAMTQATEVSKQLAGANETNTKLQTDIGKLTKNYENLSGDFKEAVIKQLVDLGKDLDVRIKKLDNIGLKSTDTSSLESRKEKHLALFNEINARYKNLLPKINYFDLGNHTAHTNVIEKIDQWNTKFELISEPLNTSQVNQSPNSTTQATQDIPNGPTTQTTQAKQVNQATQTSTIDLTIQNTSQATHDTQTTEANQTNQKKQATQVGSTNQVNQTSQTTTSIEHGAKPLTPSGPTEIGGTPNPVLTDQTKGFLIHGHVSNRDTHLNGENKYSRKAENLTLEQIQNLFEKGLVIQAPGGTHYDFSCANSRPTATLPAEAHNTATDEDKAKLAFTIISMINNVIRNSSEVKVDTHDPFVAQVAHEYSKYLEANGVKAKQFNIVLNEKPYEHEKSEVFEKIKPQIEAAKDEKIIGNKWDENIGKPDERGVSFKNFKEQFKKNVSEGPKNPIEKPNENLSNTLGHH